MCTAITYKTKDFYFGRTLDYEYSYDEKVTITPRNYPINFREKVTIKSHYAIIGMAFIVDNFPLYYDAVNEKGLAMAGLNFTNNASYNNSIKGKDNIAQFEFILYVLSTCDCIKKVKKLLNNINITDTPFNKTLPVASLHWIIADSNQAITVEATKDGLHIYDNKIGALTNNPPFDKQLENLKQYEHLSNSSKTDLKIKPEDFSRGLGAIGLPGDLSSPSRFVRVSFVKTYSLSNEDELSSVSQFFHILNSVDQQRGCCKLNDNDYEITIYTSCCNTNKGIYYYTTYDNHQINAVDMHKEDLESEKLISYPLLKKETINYQN